MRVARAKLSDVARLAGVSPATVSRVLNGHPQVAPELVERVRLAQEQLGYRPDSVARGLRSRATAVIGAVVPDVTNPFFTEMVRGLEDVMRANGYLVFLCNTDETQPKESEYLQLLVDQRVAGLIIAPVLERSEVLGQVVRSGTPVVAVDRRVPEAGVDAVLLENAGVAREITLALLGRTRRVGMISGPSGSTTADERRAGFLAALAETGIAADRVPLLEADYSEEGGYRAGGALLALDEVPEAVFVANNLMALGMLRAMRQAGVGADRMRLASFDPLPWNADPAHRVLAAEVPSRRMGEQAALLLLERIRGFAGPARELRFDAPLSD